MLFLSPPQKQTDAFSTDESSSFPSEYSNGGLEPSCPASNEDDLNRLRSSISVLFSFVRVKHKDEVFVDDVRGWLDCLVAVLLRIADRTDHLFILNHCLRCPAGLGKWAARYPLEDYGYEDYDRFSCPPNL
jgi:hypothetical protein